jgi:DNA polymerase-3 subunit gamma/tau
MATTEAHKLPDTILSRTQRFNFKPISNPDLVSQLGKIAAAEKLKIEPEALEVIATAARGGSRDAISLLDQLGTSGISPITADAVRELLGYSSSEDLSALATAIASSDAKTALQTLSRLAGQGAQPGQLATQLADIWRGVLHTTAGAAKPADPLVDSLSAGTSPAQAARIVEGLLEVTKSHWPQLTLETVIVRLANPAPGEQPRRSVEATAPRTAVPVPVPQAASAPAQDPTASAQAAPAPTASGQLSSSLWPKVLVVIKSQNNSLCALLQMYPVDFGDGEVTIKPRFNFHRDLFLKPANRTLLESAAAKVYGQPVRVSAVTEGKGKTTRSKTDPSAELVSSALEILGGEIVE